MSVQRLKYIQALGKHRNFKHASTELGISQPALSKAVKQLEEQYGVVLFERSTRQVKPTEFGLILMEYADQIVPQYNEIEREMELLKGFEKGKLVIGTDPYLAESSVADAMTIMLHEHPRLRYKIVTGQMDDLLKQLGEKHIDIVIGAPLNDLLPNLDYFKYDTPPMHIFARKGHPIFEKKEAHLEDCFSYPIVGIDTPQYLKDWVADSTSFTKTDEKVLDPVLALCDNFGLIKHLVKTTDSIAAAPTEFMDELLNSGDFEEVHVHAGPMPRSQFGLAILKGRLIPPAVQRFMEVFKEVMKKRG